jgi:hypothetical protein
MTLLGGGIWPKSLLLAFIFHPPVKFGVAIETAAHINNSPATARLCLVFINVSFVTSNHRSISEPAPACSNSGPRSRRRDAEVAEITL